MNAYADVFEDGRIKLSGNFLAFGHKSFYITDADLLSLAEVMAAWKAAHAVDSPEVRHIDEYLRKDVE
jgi:hypothetical protein